MRGSPPARVRVVSLDLVIVKWRWRVRVRRRKPRRGGVEEGTVRTPRVGDEVEAMVGEVLWVWEVGWG